MHFGRRSSRVLESKPRRASRLVGGGPRHGLSARGAGAGEALAAWRGLSVGAICGGSVGGGDGIGVGEISGAKVVAVAGASGVGSREARETSTLVLQRLKELLWELEFSDASRRSSSADEAMTSTGTCLYTCWPTRAALTSHPRPCHSIT